MFVADEKRYDKIIYKLCRKARSEAGADGAFVGA